MGFATGIALGQRQGVLDDEPLRNARPALAYAAVTRPSYAMRGHNQLGTPQQAFNPSAIHQRAAEMVLQEKEMELQKTALEVERMKQANALLAEGTKTARSNREIGESQASAAAIEKDYQAGMGRSKDWQGAQDRQLEAGKDIQRQDYKKAMAGLFQGNGDAMKNYINRYGDPNANVDSIQFNPNGSGEILVTPSASKDGKKQKAMAFKDLEQFSTAYAMFLHPDSAGMLAQAKSPQKALTIKEAADIRLKGEEEAAKTIGLMPGTEPTPAQAKAIKAAGQEAINNAIATAGAVGKEAGGILRGGPKQVEGKVKIPNMGKDKPPIEGAVKSPKDGNWYIKDKNGKWNLIEEEGASTATKTGETAAGGERWTGDMPEPPTDDEEY